MQLRLRKQVIMWLVLTVYVLLLQKADSESVISGYATCDNEMKLFVDGVLVSQHDDWTSAVSLSVPTSVKVMGIECVDLHVVGGIKAWLKNGIMTDSSWKCSSNASDGWNLPGFDDSEWDYAVLPSYDWGNLPLELDGKAEWIWTNGWRGQDKHVYCRKDISTFSPAPSTPASSISDADDSDYIFVHACENNGSFRLTCPADTKIEVISGMYGRTNDQLCPGPNQHNTACNNSVTDTIVDKCDGKKLCEIESGNAMFGDPCQGTYKYLEIKYKCKAHTPAMSVMPTTNLDVIADESGFIHMYACENNGPLRLTCPANSYIKVLSGMYGRTINQLCPGPNQNNTECYNSVTSSVVDDCDGEEQCEVQPTNAKFGDPCQGTYKYLSVVYKCSSLEEGVTERPMINVEPTADDSKVILVHTCENNQPIRITCPAHSEIEIISGMYGRINNQLCPGPNQNNTICYNIVTSTIMDDCEGKKQCEVNPTNAKFGDPCQGTYKYLQVKYKCNSIEPSRRIIPTTTVDEIAELGGIFDQEVSNSDEVSSDCPEVLFQNRTTEEMCLRLTVESGGNTVNFVYGKCSVRKCSGNLLLTSKNGGWNVLVLKGHSHRFPVKMIILPCIGLLVLVTLATGMLLLCRRRNLGENLHGNHQGGVDTAVDNVYIGMKTENDIGKKPCICASIDKVKY